MGVVGDNRDRAVRRVIVVEGLANATVIATKLWAGLTTGSLAILSDAAHSLADLLNNVLTWLVVRVSAEPADEKHPYGHRKFESLAVFTLAMLLVLLAFELLSAALLRASTSVANSPLALALMLATLGVNAGLAWWQRGRARALEADILYADASHTFSDALTTLSVIVGWLLAANGYPWVDRVAAGAVALIVLWLAYQLFRRAVPILVDESAIDAGQVARALSGIKGVLAVRRVRSRRTGTGLALDAELLVDAELSVARGEVLRQQANEVLVSHYGEIDAVIALVSTVRCATPRPLRACCCTSTSAARRRQRIRTARRR